MEELPGPEVERLRRVMEQQRDETDRELRDGPPFPVYEAVGTGLEDVAIGGYASTDGVLESLELVRAGDTASCSGPMVAVRTEGGDTRGYPFGPEDLPEWLAEERDRRADESGVDVPEPTRVESRRVVLLVDGIDTHADLRIEDDCWAALLTVPRDDASSEPLRLLVTARGVPFEQVRLARVTDLGPYVSGHVRLRDRMAAQALSEPYVAPEDLDLPHADGFEAHHALIDMVLASVLANRPTAEGGRRRPARHTRADGDTWTRGWESATRAQMRMAGQNRYEAADAVSALVNQMIRLDETTAWFPGEQDARTAAIEESVRWTVFDSDVPSRSAQEAWAVSRSASSGPFLAGIDDAIPDALGARNDLPWRRAWEAWHSARS